MTRLPALAGRSEARYPAEITVEKRLTGSIASVIFVALVR